MVRVLVVPAVVALVACGAGERPAVPVLVGQESDRSALDEATGERGEPASSGEDEGTGAPVRADAGAR